VQLHKLDDFSIKKVGVLCHEEMSSGKFLKNRSRNPFHKESGVFRRDEAVFPSRHDKRRRLDLTETVRSIVIPNRVGLTR
jgi:hypothetical protein